ncbi:MAG TPA: hypothetical protein VGQ36_12420 [Thermoanaerobaculia bacterium]|nr:hypothetical protein [Thermoanaerobaculia bacterium]
MTVLAVAVLEREPALLAGFDDGRVVAVAAGTERVICTMNAPVESLAVTADQTTVIATDTAGAVEYRALADGRLELSLSWANKIKVAAALDADRHAGVDSKGNFVLWSRDGGAFVSTALRNNISGMAVREDGLVVLTRALRWLLWDPFTSAFTQPFETVDGMRLSQQNGTAGVSRNGRFFYVYWDDFLLFDAVTGAPLREGRSAWYVHTTSLSDDGRLLLMGGKAGWLGAVDDKDELVLDLRVGEDDVHDVVLSPDGRLGAWRDRAGRAGLIDVAARQVIRAVHAISTAPTDE